MNKNKGGLFDINNGNSMGQAIISGTESERNIIHIKNTARKKPPTMSDISELQSLLDDFQIHVSIPEFKNAAEMDLWRKRQIKSKLKCRSL